MEKRCANKMVPRSEEEIAQLKKRLNRIEGQVRGINKMVEEDRYCIDILTQVLAVEAAMRKVGFSLVERHVSMCVADALESGDAAETTEELMSVLRRFAK